jgi:hypothetical protein
MSLIISDDTLRAWDMTEEEFKLELAVMLFQACKMAVGRASTRFGYGESPVLRVAEVSPNSALLLRCRRL